MKFSTNLSLILLLLLFTAPAVAGDKDYDIELILFERSGGGSQEAWPINPGSPDMQNARSLEKGAGPFSIRPASVWQLKNEAARLQATSGITPLIHLAWRQPVASSKDAEPIRLRSSSTGKLEGTVKVSLGRYLHVDLDLLLDHRYRFQAHRRMRSGEIHYIDHPLMGALVLISPVTDAKTSD